MKKLSPIFLILFLISLTLALPTTVKTAENSIKSVNDTVLSVFKKYHLLHLEELSSSTELTAAIARPDDSIFKDGKVVHDHDHSKEEVENEEHLNIIIFKATPDAEGNYHTPTVKLGERVYTYKEIYTVLLTEKSVYVKMTRAVKNSPKRAEAEPNQLFLKDLAKQLQGNLASVGNIIILP